MHVKNQVLSNLSKWHSSQTKKNEEPKETVAPHISYRLELDKFNSTVDEAKELDQSPSDNDRESGSVDSTVRNPHYANVIHSLSLSKSLNGFMLKKQDTLLHHTGNGPCIPENNYTVYNADEEKNVVQVTRKQAGDSKPSQFTLDFNRGLMIIADEQG